MTAAIPNATILIKRPATNANEPVNSARLLPGNQTKAEIASTG
jgi:hypothetical protein